MEEKNEVLKELDLDTMEQVSGGAIEKKYVKCSSCGKVTLVVYSGGKGICTSCRKPV